MFDEGFPPHSDALLTRYLESQLRLQAEREALEREFEQRRLELDTRAQELEFEQREAVLKALQARGGVWVCPGLGTLERLERPSRVRVVDEAALIVWLEQHLPELLRPRVRVQALIERLRPEGAQVRDTQSGQRYALPPGLEALPAQSRLTFAPAFRQAENTH